MYIEEISKNIEEKLEELAEEQERLSDLEYDYGDVGNAIGYALGSLTQEEIEDFIVGLRHGLSLRNGTH